MRWEHAVRGRPRFGGHNAQATHHKCNIDNHMSPHYNTQPPIRGSACDYLRSAANSDQSVTDPSHVCFNLQAYNERHALNACSNDTVTQGTTCPVPCFNLHGHGRHAPNACSPAKTTPSTTCLVPYLNYHNTNTVTTTTSATRYTTTTPTRSRRAPTSAPP